MQGIGTDAGTDDLREEDPLAGEGRSKAKKVAESEVTFFSF